MATSLPTLVVILVVLEWGMMGHPRLLESSSDYKLILRNVGHVTSIRLNLISIGRLDEED